MRAAVMRDAEFISGAVPWITERVGVDGVTGLFERLGAPDEHAEVLVEPWR